MSQEETKKRFKVMGKGRIQVRSDGVMKRYEPGQTFHEYRSVLPAAALRRGDIEELPGPEERRKRNSNRGSGRGGGSSSKSETTKSQSAAGEGEGSGEGSGEGAGEDGE